MNGYFIPPVDGNYTFFLSGDDLVKLYISKTPYSTAASD
jgi:hypothetical protein